MRRWVVLKRISQVVFFFLFVYILWSAPSPLKGLLHPRNLFKVDPLLTFTTSITTRAVLPGILFSFLMLLLTLLCGRFFCGWICPLGTTIDLVGSLRRRRANRKTSADGKWRAIKFYLLGLLLLLAILGRQLSWLFDPLVITARFVSLNLIPATTLLLNKLFIFLVRDLGFSGRVYDFYRSLKGSLLGVNVYFHHSALILFSFLFICGLALLKRRLWCRYICPLGAIYSLLARFSFLRRVADERCTKCKKCKSLCRMGAIKDDANYEKGECILCMDCLYGCGQSATQFTWPARKRLPRKKNAKNTAGPNDISRRNFILLIFLSWISASGFGRKWRGFEARTSKVIRPPGVVSEEDFLNRCIRCGNCMKACPTNGLQPLLLETGSGAVLTPHLVPKIGYCEYNCTQCGDVCPTGAIPRLRPKEKQKFKLGVAQVDRSICLAWAEDKECIVCEEHCPVPEKAIKLRMEKVSSAMIPKPYVDEMLCIGCGTCQNKCPVRPLRAIRVVPR